MTLVRTASVAVGLAALGTAAAVAAPGAPKQRPAVVHVLPFPFCPAPAPTAVQPPSRGLRDTFGVLRRERTPADALPADAASVLARRGVTGFSPDATRLLRTSKAGGRAWVVPVPDVRPATFPGLVCGPPVGPVPPVPPVPRRPQAPPASPPAPRVPAAPSGATPTTPAPPKPRARPVPPRTTVPSVPRAPGRARTAPLPAPLEVVPASPVPRPVPPEPQEGLVVVTQGGVAGGGTGGLADLFRGRATPAVEPCADGRPDLVRVSGIVPDHVDRVFLTAHDGSAVEATPQDNGYAFTVRADRRGAPRYVVWTPAGGTPRVQPVEVRALPRQIRCAPRPATAASVLAPPATASLAAGRTGATRPARTPSRRR